MLRFFKITLGNILESHASVFEFIRYGFVGLVATGLHYGLYLLLLRYINMNIAYTLGYGISFIFNFLLSNYFTFQTKPTLLKGIGFGISHLINYLLHIGLLNLFVWMNLKKQVAPIPVYAIVIPVNFFLVRLALKSPKRWSLGKKPFLDGH